MSVIIKEGTDKKEQFKLLCLIYELNGMVKSMSELVNYDDEYNNPLLEPLEEKMKQVMAAVETINEKISA